MSKADCHFRHATLSDWLIAFRWLRQTSPKAFASRYDFFFLTPCGAIGLRPCEPEPASLLLFTRRRHRSSAASSSTRICGTFSDPDTPVIALSATSKLRLQYHRISTAGGFSARQQPNHRAQLSLQKWPVYDSGIRRLGRLHKENV